MTGLSRDNEDCSVRDPDLWRGIFIVQSMAATMPALPVSSRASGRSGRRRRGGRGMTPGFPGHRGGWHRQRRRLRAPRRGQRRVPAHARRVAAGAWMRLDAVALRARQNVALEPSRPRPKAQPAGRGPVRGQSASDHADRLPGGVLGHDQFGPVGGQHARHRFGVTARGRGARAVMSTAIWPGPFLVIFSVPSRMAQQAASRMGQSRLPDHAAGASRLLTGSFCRVTFRYEISLVLSPTSLPFSRLPYRAGTSEDL